MMFRLSLNRVCQSFSDLKVHTHFEVKTVLINFESIRKSSSFFTRGQSKSGSHPKIILNLSFN